MEGSLFSNARGGKDRFSGIKIGDGLQRGESQKPESVRKQRGLQLKTSGSRPKSIKAKKLFEKGELEENAMKYDLGKVMELKVKAANLTKKGKYQEKTQRVVREDDRGLRSKKPGEVLTRNEP